MGQWQIYVSLGLVTAWVSLETSFWAQKSFVIIFLANIYLSHSRHRTDPKSWSVRVSGKNPWLLHTAGSLITGACSPSISEPRWLSLVTSSGFLHLGMSMMKSIGEPLGTNWLNAFILFVNLSEDMIFWPFPFSHLNTSHDFPPHIAGAHSHIHMCTHTPNDHRRGKIQQSQNSENTWRAATQPAFSLCLSLVCLQHLNLDQYWHMIQF